MCSSTSFNANFRLRCSKIEVHHANAVPIKKLNYFFLNNPKIK